MAAQKAQPIAIQVDTHFVHHINLESSFNNIDYACF